MDFHLSNIGQIIQLAIAPVFLLTGVGTQLGVLASRLARIIDRSRNLEKSVQEQGKAFLTSNIRAELDELYQRAYLINRAITLSTTCALLICLVIAALFIGDALHKQLSQIIAILFVVGILSLIGSFVYFLREIFVATKTMTRQRQQNIELLSDPS